MTPLLLAMLAAPGALVVDGPACAPAWLDRLALVDVLAVDSASTALARVDLAVLDCAARDEAAVDVAVHLRGRVEPVRRAVALADVARADRTRALALAIQGMVAARGGPAIVADVADLDDLALELAASAALRIHLPTERSLTALRFHGARWLGAHRLGLELVLTTGSTPASPDERLRAELLAIELGVSYLVAHRAGPLRIGGGAVLSGGAATTSGDAGSTGLPVGEGTRALLSLGGRGEVSVDVTAWLFLRVQVDVVVHLVGVEARVSGEPLLGLSTASAGVGAGVGVRL